MFKNLKSKKYPVLLLRDVVLFPQTIAPLFVGRSKSVAAMDKALGGDRQVLLLTQKKPNDDNPKLIDVFHIGTIATIQQLLRRPDGVVNALVEGNFRVKVIKFDEHSDIVEAEVEELVEISQPLTDEAEVLVRTAISQFAEYIKLNRKIPPQMLSEAGNIREAGKLADMLASLASIKILEKQKLLEELDPLKRLEEVCGLLEAEISMLKNEQNLRSKVKSQVEQKSKSLLADGLRSFKELDDEVKDELAEFEEKIKSLKMTDEAREKALSELKKLRSMSPLSSEASVIRNYLDWLVTVPWNNPSPIEIDIAKAEEVLNADHFGLEQVKERILEYLAVQSRTGANGTKMKGPILCLVGPPGVGKTSLGYSIAKATGREFAKIALGGMRDEAEIRGHRRTYLGSMPGKIIQSMKKTKTSNPLLLLDEIEKMSQDFRGDPASALLEVLDPEQNHKFSDHYMEVDYDLSDVMFIATANSLRLPRPLLDRLEIIRISGYTEDEKIEIAKNHLIPKLLESHGLQKKEWSISDDALLILIRYYTREAGVRSLEREMAGLIRKAVKEIVSGKKTVVKVTKTNVEKYAKVRKYSFGQTETKDLVGVTTGLAYTETGGDILQIEVVKATGKGKFVHTGNLEKVMYESIQAAASFVRSRCLDFGIQPRVFQETDVHVHVPEGATPKDGPSAGVAMCTSIVSVLTGIPVKKNVAMTGEITLRGRVLPIGGLKEKLLAALRSGIEIVLIPHENVKDLAEIPDNVKNHLQIIPVMTADEVLKHALVRKLKPVELEVRKDSRKDEDEDSPRLAH